MTEPTWIGWRWWAVEGENGTDEMRLVSPFASEIWSPGVFVSRGAEYAVPTEAGVFALAGFTPIDGWRASFPNDLATSRRIVLGRVLMWGRLRSIGSQSVSDYARVISLDKVESGRVDLGRLRRVYGTSRYKDRALKGGRDHGYAIFLGGWTVDWDAETQL